MKNIKVFKISSIFFELQKIGQSLAFPIAVLPVAGFLLRIGFDDLLNSQILRDSGEIVFKSLPLIFSIGVAGGIAKDRDSSSALAGALSYLTIDTVSKVINQDNSISVFGGIIAGLIGGYTYNRFNKIQLPIFLAFFGGKRFVPIASSILSMFFGIILGSIWPYISSGLGKVTLWITNSGGLGFFLYGFLNRSLLPFGLQHILNSLIFFVLGEFKNPNTGEIINGDLNRFFAGDPSAGIFLSGFYPIMIFGLPSAAIAMCLCVNKENRSKISGLLFSGALTSFLTGITEPLEFAFLFSAPLLYTIHAIFTGLSLYLSYLFDIHAGFTFSAGLIDMILSWKLFSNGPILILLGSFFSILYFTVFYSLTKIFNLNTPGREIKTISDKSSDQISSSKNYKKIAPLCLQYLGSSSNIEELNHCITRVRIKLKNPELINEEGIKKLFPSGIIKIHDTIQIVVGTDVEFLAEEIKSLL